MGTTPTPQLLNRLRMRQVALLLAIDRMGTLRAAAHELGMTQPAATKMLHELEHALGHALFERAGFDAGAKGVVGAAVAVPDGLRAQVAGQAVEAGGSGEIYRLSGCDEAREDALRALFDRGEEYANIAGEIKDLGRIQASLDGAVAARKLQALVRRFEQVTRIDFFPGEAQRQTLSLLDDLRFVFMTRWYVGQADGTDPTPLIGGFGDIDPADPSTYPLIGMLIPGEGFDPANPATYPIIGALIPGGGEGGEGAGPTGTPVL